MHVHAHAEHSRAHETHVHAHGEGKGREGKGKEGKGREFLSQSQNSESQNANSQFKSNDIPNHSQNAPNSKENAVPLNENKKTKVKVATPVSILLEMRRRLHQETHQCKPLENAQVNGMLSNLLKLAGQDVSTKVLIYFYRVPNNFYREKAHDLKLLIHDLSKLTTEVERAAPILKDQRADSYNQRVKTASVAEEILRRAQERGET
jgi:hypothetical protein